MTVVFILLIYQHAVLMACSYINTLLNSLIGNSITARQESGDFRNVSLERFCCVVKMQALMMLDILVIQINEQRLKQGL